MNDQFDPNRPLSADEKLTAWVLGELSADEAKAFEVEMEASAELQAKANDLGQTLRILEDARELPTLSAQSKESILTQVPATQLDTVVHRVHWKSWSKIAALVAVGVVFSKLEGGGERERAMEASASTITALNSPDGGTYQGPGDTQPPSDKNRKNAVNGIPGGKALSSARLAPGSPPAEGVRNLALHIGGGAGGSYRGRQGGRSGGRDGKGGRASKLGLVRVERESQASLGDRRARRQDLGQDRFSTKDKLGLGEAIKGVADEPTMSLERRRLAELAHASGGEWQDDSLGLQGFGFYDDSGRVYYGDDICHHLRPIRPDETARDMFFRFYGDHPFVQTELDGLSTFAADVDTASYPLVRNYLVDKKLPPKDGVRTEEFLNYFQNEIAPPKQGDFTVQLEAAPSPFGGNPDSLLVKIGIKAREISKANRKPLNLVFVVDRSGSMNRGNRMELVKKTLELLVDQVEAGDTIGLVSFNSSGHRELDPTSATERWKIRDAVRALKTGGSTNAAEGLFLGYEMAEKAFRKDAVNRVILCSDGVANTGETDQIKILERVREMGEQHIDLTTIGVGMGNHNDVFLEQLANIGNGSCHYVDDYQEAKRVMVEGFVGTLQTIARDVKIQVEFDPKHVKSWRQIGYENRAVADEDFRNDAVDAGEVGAGHEVVALYEVVQAHSALADGPFMKVRLRWFPDGSKEALETETVLAGAQVSQRPELASNRFRLSAAVAQFAEVLRRSYHAQEDSYDDLMDEAEALAQALPKDSAVSEFRDMVRRTRELVRLLPPRDELYLLVEEARRLRVLEAELRFAKSNNEKTEAYLKELSQRNQELEKLIRIVHLNRRSIHPGYRW